MPSGEFAERIFRFIQARGYEPQQIRQLAQTMGVGDGELGDFHQACKALMRSGRIIMGAKSAVTLPDPAGRIVGSFRANPRGFGFVIPDTPNSHGDLYVPPGSTGGALTGDTVSARVKKRGKRDGRMMYEGKIVEIIRRGKSRFVGELRKEFSRWFVVPDGNALHGPIMVGDPGAKGARPGDQVVVEITQYSDGGQEHARGVLIKVLGHRGDPGVDTLSIIEQYGLPGEFDEAVLESARRAIADYDPQREAKGREDLRKLLIITIDPDTARDFDDAISLTQNADGSCELGVHIADVAHFVRPGTAMDDEALKRGNSIYLPDHVIPMLPEVLSNGICSLQEGEPRLTKSAFIAYDKRGKVKKARVANTIIRSAKRLTYAQATSILDGKRGVANAKVVALLKAMDDLARRIRARRIRVGMLTLDLPSAELVLDKHGLAIDVEPEDTSFSHTIIEMFMVEANEAVARLFNSIRVPALRRIHDEPSPSSTDSLCKFLEMFGFRLKGKPDRFVLQKLLASVRDKPESFSVNLAVLRTMQRAEYSPLQIGHYALAGEDYCHFTSPIRRYPDLTIHRLIHTYLAGGFKGRKRPADVPNTEQLTELGRHLSTQERQAESAERELKLVMTLRLIERRLGDVFEGTVTGVANFGIFVQLDRYLIDGVLRFAALPDDWWEVDSRRGAVVGERSGVRITVGDRIKVKASRVDLPARQLELDLAEPLRGATPGGGRVSKRRFTARQSSPPRRGPSQPDRGKGKKSSATKTKTPKAKTTKSKKKKSKKTAKAKSRKVASPKKKRRKTKRG